MGQQLLFCNGTHRFLVIADDGKLLVKNINITKEETEPLLDDDNKIGLDVNMEECKYIFMSSHQSAVQGHNVKVANKSFENVAEVKCFGMAIKNQNCIH
jgi:hypothetical protein